MHYVDKGIVTGALLKDWPMRIHNERSRTNTEGLGLDHKSVLRLQS